MCRSQEKKHLVYKCTHYKRIGHLEPFYFNKLERSKDNNIIYSETNALGTKKMWASKVKP